VDKISNEKVLVLENAKPAVQQTTKEEVKS